jgi:hypothetical protein
MHSNPSSVSSPPSAPHRSLRAHIEHEYDNLRFQHLKRLHDSRAVIDDGVPRSHLTRGRVDGKAIIAKYVRQKTIQEENQRLGDKLKRIYTRKLESQTQHFFDSELDRMRRHTQACFDHRREVEAQKQQYENRWIACRLNDAPATIGALEFEKHYKTTLAPYSKLRSRLKPKQDYGTYLATRDKAMAEYLAARDAKVERKKQEMTAWLEHFQQELAETASGLPPDQQKFMLAKLNQLDTSAFQDRPRIARPARSVSASPQRGRSRSRPVSAMNLSLASPANKNFNPYKKQKPRAKSAGPFRILPGQPLIPEPRWNPIDDEFFSDIKTPGSRSASNSPERGSRPGTAGASRPHSASNSVPTSPLKATPGKFSRPTSAVTKQRPTSAKAEAAARSAMESMAAAGAAAATASKRTLELLEGGEAGSSRDASPSKPKRRPGSAAVHLFSSKGSRPGSAINPGATKSNLVRPSSAILLHTHDEYGSRQPTSLESYVTQGAAGTIALSRSATSAILGTKAMRSKLSDPKLERELQAILYNEEMAYSTLRPDRPDPKSAFGSSINVASGPGLRGSGSSKKQKLRREKKLLSKKEIEDAAARRLHQIQAQKAKDILLKQARSAILDATAAGNAHFEALRKNVRDRELGIKHAYGAPITTSASLKSSASAASTKPPVSSFGSSVSHSSLSRPSAPVSLSSFLPKSQVSSVLSYDSDDDHMDRGARLVHVPGESEIAPPSRPYKAPAGLPKLALEAAITSDLKAAAADKNLPQADPGDPAADGAAEEAASERRDRARGKQDWAEALAEVPTPKIRSSRASDHGGQPAARVPTIAEQLGEFKEAVDAAPFVVKSDLARPAGRSAILLPGASAGDSGLPARKGLDALSDAARLSTDLSVQDLKLLLGQPMDPLASSGAKSGTKSRPVSAALVLGGGAKSRPTSAAVLGASSAAASEQRSALGKSASSATLAGVGSSSSGGRSRPTSAAPAKQTFVGGGVGPNPNITAESVEKFMKNSVSLQALAAVGGKKS